MSSSRPLWLSQQPSALDIVTAYYPETQPQGDLRLRPCLVMNVLRGKDDGAIACHLTYGTKNLRLAQRQHLDLIVQNMQDMDAMGLAVATRFVLDERAFVTLPWTEEFFGCWSGYNSPRIGTLLEDYRRDFAYQMIKFVANRDNK